MKTYIIVDFEATCCNANSIGRQEMEIIEIGAVAVDANTLENKDEFQSFVKPVRYPQLTEFCSELTSITQKDVEGADNFPVVLHKFALWLQKFPDSVFCSWGQYDKNQLLQDCVFHKVEFPFSEQHINLKNEFSKQMKSKRRFGMKAALKKVNLSLDGTHHRGIDDARNMVKLMPYIVQGTKSNS